MGCALEVRAKGRHAGSGEKCDGEDPAALVQARRWGEGNCPRDRHGSAGHSHICNFEWTN